MKRLYWLVFIAAIVLVGCKVEAEFDTDGENKVNVELNKKAEVAPGFDENPMKEDVVAFVDEAAVELETKGEAAFDEFRKQGSAWYEGDRYVFVWGLDGMRYCYPPNVDGEGEDMAPLCDPEGRPIGKMILEAANGDEGHGWVHYQWNKPDSEEYEWKSTYVQRVAAPDGKGYLVGSGLYKSDQ